MTDDSSRKFVRHRGTVIPLDRANVDTDQIIPKQFLKSIKRTGFGENLFDAWRFLDEGEIGKTERLENPDFVLNDARYRHGSILLTRRNFGCGSSREHAVWAILQYGIKCVLAPAFADIFYNNSINNGLLPVILGEPTIQQLFVEATSGHPLIVAVDLEKQTISSGSGTSSSFEIDGKSRRRLLTGMNEVRLTLQYAEKIREFEREHERRMPWLFGKA